MQCKLKTIAIIVFIGLICIFRLHANSIANAVPASPSAAGPAEIFADNCAKCHGTDGKAKTAKGKRLHATDFTSDWNTDESRGIRIITNGRDEMPSFKKTLTQDEIRDVFHYVVSFKQ